MTDAELAATFLAIGADYERCRPGFPQEIAAAVAPTRVRVALDLGAGTGKFTESLVARADRVIAVDPSEPMLAELRTKLPHVDARIGTAEAIPVPPASCDLVTVAQAYHWFDPESAPLEMRRVLAASGRLALIWNGPDPRCAWDATAHRIAHAADDVETSDSGELPILEVPGFSLVSVVRVAWSEQITRTDYLARWLTASTLLAADGPERTHVLGRIEEELDSDDETRGRRTLRLPHLTDALLYEVAN